MREVTCPTFDNDPASRPCDAGTKPVDSQPCDDGSGCPAFDMYCPLGYDDTQVGGCEKQAALVATLQTVMMGCIAMCCLAWTYKRCKRPKKGKATIKFERDSTFQFKDAAKKDLEEDGSHDAPPLTKEEIHRQEVERKKMMQAARGGKSKTTWHVVKDKSTGKKKIVWNVDHIKDVYGHMLNPMGRGTALTTVGAVVNAKEGAPGSPGKGEVVPGTPVSQARKSVSPNRRNTITSDGSVVGDSANLRLSTIDEGVRVDGGVRVSDINLLSADGAGGNGLNKKALSGLAATKIQSDMSLNPEFAALMQRRNSAEARIPLCFLYQGRVEYFSATHQKWIPSIVQNYDVETQTLGLLVQMRQPRAGIMPETVRPMLTHGEEVQILLAAGEKSMWIGPAQIVRRLGGMRGYVVSMDADATDVLQDKMRKAANKGLAREATMRDRERAHKMKKYENAEEFTIEANKIRRYYKQGDRVMVFHHEAGLTPMGSVASLDADDFARKELPIWKEAVIEECFGGRDLANGDTLTRENTMRGYTMGEQTFRDQTFASATGGLASSAGGNLDPNELSQKLGALEMSAPPKTPGKSRHGMDREGTNMSFMNESGGRRNSLQLPPTAAGRVRASQIVKGRHVDAADTMGAMSMTGSFAPSRLNSKEREDTMRPIREDTMASRRSFSMDSVGSQMEPEDVFSCAMMVRFVTYTKKVRASESGEAMTYEEESLSDPTLLIAGTCVIPFEIATSEDAQARDR